MSYYGNYYNRPRDSRAAHEKIWSRTKAIAWDEKWRALSTEARQAYLTEIKAPTREGSTTQPSILADRIKPAILDELTAAGFVKIEPPQGRKAAKIVASQNAYDFSARLRAAYRHDVLKCSNREELARSIKYAFTGNGEPTLQRVLSHAGILGYHELENALELYLTTRRWPDWAVGLCKSKAARPVINALIKAPGPVELARLPAKVKGAKPAEVQAAVSELIALLAVFESVDAETFEIIVGILPEVRDDIAEAAKPRTRPPLVVCEHPKEVSPPGGLLINDLRVFLLEIAGESPRLRQDGGIFAKDEPKLRQALPARPAWLDQSLHTSDERRLGQVYALAMILKFVEPEQDERTTWLRLSGKGRNWLAAGFEEQHARVYEYYQATEKRQTYDDFYDANFGDSKFLGIPVIVTPQKSGRPTYYSYYSDIKPEDRDALRNSLLKIFQSLPVGVFHRWESVRDHFCFEENNPLTQGKDLSKFSIVIDRAVCPQLPEMAELAGKSVLDHFLAYRLLPLDAVRAAIDAEGKLCIARIPRLDGYFGRPYQVDETDSVGSTRVIVQPDFSILVIGLDPSPAAEIAPFCQRVGGQGGQGVMTFKITRDSVIRAASQGLTASAIVARLKKHASIEVPENILREIQEWANWVRLVNVRNITVVRCPDKETVSRVVSALGKKSERLSDTLVAIHEPNLSSAERQKLQEQGILVTKKDIAISPEPGTPVIPSTKPTALKKRGRPRKTY